MNPSTSTRTRFTFEPRGDAHVTTKRALAGVAHDVAHHACSGVSWLSPHLAQALRAAGSDSADVELLDSDPYPRNAVDLQPLRSALSALSEKALAILSANGFSRDDVRSIRLFVTPAPWDATGYTLHARTIITSRDDRTYDSGWLR